MTDRRPEEGGWRKMAADKTAPVMQASAVSRAGGGASGRISENAVRVMKELLLTEDSGQ